MIRCFVSLLLCALALSPLTAQDVPWLADVNTPPEQYLENEQIGLPEASVTQAWPSQRAKIRDQWKTFLGAYSFPDLPLKMETLREERLDHCTRRLIHYQAEPGRIVRAYLLIPHDHANSKLPAVVAFHGTNPRTFDKLVGLDAEPERHMGLRLAKAGFVVICPENFLWEKDSYKASTEAALKNHPGSKGMAVMLADGMRAVDLLLTLDQVDPKRIGTYGHSLGAKEAMYLAAMDDRICAAVASEGGVEISFSNWDAVWYLGSDVKQEGFSRKHEELIALIAGRPFLVLGGESGRGCADGQRSWKALHTGHQVWQAHFDKPVRMGLLNHGQGHSLPWEAGEKVIQWMVAYVASQPVK
ncbi:Alpha/beta hydrolase family protein [Bremerella volcania]|uniref:Alpha/beta hydrolase family protein n=1 Tax=Bremerella volcania TaxID=2527984 RepID=A0A518C6S7_9BACT|nr:dienelactone hydrolase family protein [Bremerella volcania]QDU74933.1 Alpha/beta hydrolase family protein [Bremerella volcania]